MKDTKYEVDLKTSRLKYKTSRNLGNVIDLDHKLCADEHPFPLTLSSDVKKGPKEDHLCPHQYTLLVTKDYSFKVIIDHTYNKN